MNPPSLRPLLFVGEALAEVMRPAPDLPLDTPGPFAGPFPSGAPAIAADAAARHGAPVSFIGTVGDDPFGSSFRARIERDGVDVSRLASVPALATGVAFVSYRSDGSRSFLFHPGAAGTFEAWQCQPEDLDGVRHLHISGSTVCFSPAWQAACLNIAKWALERKATLSFDPNLRPELGATGMTAIRKIVQWCHIILPSAGEAAVLSGSGSDEEAFRRLAGAGKTVVEKRGREGSRAWLPDGTVITAAVEPVDEIDPTGAGDAFAGVFLAARHAGRGIEEALHIANAAGAAAVRALGPMEHLP